MSKLSFRARALDAHKPMPVYKADEIPDLPDFAAINRAVPQMPTGMEKEEETEHHLQRALSAQQVYGSAEKLVIPIPHITEMEKDYNEIYKSDFKMGKQYIHVQGFGIDQEIADYDVDSEDENWLKEQDQKMEIQPQQFEEMMDRLEKGSGQQVVTLQEAKLLLKEDDDLIIAVYDYWLNKRLKHQQPLIATVKTEKRDGSTTNNPYVAFRRRTEKMQTRKNRKNDEVSYEKMLKLRRDLSRAVTLLEMIKRREKSKKELLQLQIEIVEQRYKLTDFNGELLNKANAERHKYPSLLPLTTYNINRNWDNRDDVSYVRKKREYKRRKHKMHIPLTVQQTHHQMSSLSQQYGDIDILGHSDLFSSEDEPLSPGLSLSDQEDENDPDGVYAFKRKKGVLYHAPIYDGLGNWPWADSSEGGLGDKKYRYCLTSLSAPRRCMGMARRRVGRGGRFLFDRGHTQFDQHLTDLDLDTSSPSSSETISCTSHNSISDLTNRIHKEKWQHFRPRSPLEGENTQTSISPLNVPILSDFNIVESFQNHQEALYAMKQQQQEELLKKQTIELENSINFEHSFSSQPTSKFMLDSASAVFAASAVVSNAPKLLNNGANGLNSVATSGPVVTLESDGKNSGFSTSPAANVLQLNFPLTTNLDDSLNINMPIDSLVPGMTSTNTLLSSSTSLISTNTSLVPSDVTISSNTLHTSGHITNDLGHSVNNNTSINNVIPVMMAHKPINPEVPNSLKVSSTALHDNKSTSNDTSVASLVKKEHIMPMEVT